MNFFEKKYSEYTQEKAMYSSLLSFGQFKLKYITRTARYWYKSGIFQATIFLLIHQASPLISM